MVEFSVSHTFPASVPLLGIFPDLVVNLLSVSLSECQRSLSSLSPACLSFCSPGPTITEAALEGTVSTVKTEGNAKTLPPNPSSSNKFHHFYLASPTPVTLNPFPTQAVDT